MNNRPKYCKWCNTHNPTHFPFQCRENPKNKNRQPIQQRKSLPKSNKPIKKVGKRTAKWLSTRSQWLKNNPPNHQGYYICYLCSRPVHYTEVTLDHIIARTKDYNLIHAHSNLAPAHSTCNNEKGSMSLEYYRLKKSKL